MDTLPPPAPEPILPQPAISRKLFWLVGGLAILIFGIAIGVFGAKFLGQSQDQSQLIPVPSLFQSPTPTPVPDPTADWKTYKDSISGFSFKYPLSWLWLDTSPARDTSRIGFFSQETQPSPSTGGHVGNEILGLTTQVSDLSFEEYIKPHLAGKYSWVDVGGRQSLEIYENPSAIIPSNIIIYANPSTHRMLTLTHIGESSSKYIDQILSTFKFLDQNE